MSEKKLISRPIAKLAVRTVLVQLQVTGDHEFLANHIAGGIMAVAAPLEPTAMVPKSEHDLLFAKYEQLELINEKLHAQIAEAARKAGN